MKLEKAQILAKAIIVGVWVVVGLQIAALAWESVGSLRGVTLHTQGLGAWLPFFLFAAPVSALAALCLWGWRLVSMNWVKAASAGILLMGGVLGFLLDEVNRSRDEGVAQVLSCTLDSKWMAQDRNRSRIAKFNCASSAMTIAIPHDLWEVLVPQGNVAMSVRPGFLGRPWIPFDEIKIQP